MSLDVKSARWYVANGASATAPALIENGER